MANGKFEAGKRFLLFWLCSQSYKQRPNYRGLTGKATMPMWPNFGQFITYSTDFAYLEVFHDALSGDWIKIQKIKN